MTKPPNLESTLFRLANADDPASFAAEHGLQLREDQVLVVIELREGADLPEEFEVEVTSAYDTQVQAYVSIAELVSLAETDAVRLIRQPRRSEPHNHTSSSQ